MIRTISSGYLTYLLKMNHLVGWFMMIYLSKWWFSCSLPIKMSVSCEVGTYQQPSTRTLVFLEDISVWAEFSSYTLGCIPAGKWLHYIYIYIHIYIYTYIYIYHHKWTIPSDIWVIYIIILWFIASLMPYPSKMHLQPHIPPGITRRRPCHRRYRSWTRATTRSWTGCAAACGRSPRSCHHRRRDGPDGYGLVEGNI